MSGGQAAVVAGVALTFLAASLLLLHLALRDQKEFRRASEEFNRSVAEARAMLLALLTKTYRRE